MNPERHPYATSLPQGGHRDTPFIPKPPTAALEVLRSFDGLDGALPRVRPHTAADLRGGKSGLRSADGFETAGDEQTLQQQRRSNGRISRASPVSAQLQYVLPITDRTSQSALESAALERTIQHEQKDYHGCQQAVLNAELRAKVEKHYAGWHATLLAASEEMRRLPMEGDRRSQRTAEDLRVYLTSYRCTDDLTVTEAALMAQQQEANQDTAQGQEDEGEEDGGDGGDVARKKGIFLTPLQELEMMLRQPPVLLDTTRRGLDDLLRSTYLLAPLDRYVTQLHSLDELSARSWSGEGGRNSTIVCEPQEEEEKTDQEGRKKNTARTIHSTTVSTTGALVSVPAEGSKKVSVISPSRTAVALHEQLHYDPSDYATRELRSTESALHRLQRKLENAKSEKEAAIVAEDAVAALRNLHAQVELSNELLVLYRSRMSLLEMHTKDLQTFRQEVVSLVADSRSAVEAVRDYALHAAPAVQRDRDLLLTALSIEESQLAGRQVATSAAASQAAAQLRAMDTDVQMLWQEINVLLVRVSAKEEQRARYVHTCMLDCERRARETAQVQARMKTQEAHGERLRQCSNTLERWTELGDVYNAFVEACAPKLLRHLAAAEDRHTDHMQKEAEDYVKVFELFLYAAEEARATRRAQADRMRLLQRSTQLTQVHAAETLDPDMDVHARRLADATQELDEVQLYLRYIDTVEKDRRAEVDPVLYGVLERDIPLSKGGQVPTGTKVVPAMKEAPDRTARRNTAPYIDGAHSAADGTVAAPPPAALEEEAGEGGSMNHPHMAARVLGLNHEEMYMSKQSKLAKREGAAAVAQRRLLRDAEERSQMPVGAFKDAEEVRALLGLDE